MEVDVIRIRSQPRQPPPPTSNTSSPSTNPPHPQQATPSPTPSPSISPSTSPPDPPPTTSLSSHTTTLHLAAHLPSLYRRWPVSIRINDGPETHATLQDPLLEAEYRSVIEQYLRSSDRPRWSAQSLGLDGAARAAAAGSGWDDGLARAEGRLRAYAEALLRQIPVRLGLFGGEGAGECRVVVVEDGRGDEDGEHAAATAATMAGIHCLAWELLETVHLAHRPNLHFRVTRETEFPHLHDHHQRHHATSRSETLSPDPLHLRPSPPPPYPAAAPSPLLTLPPPRPLADVQANKEETFRILLVVARDFSRTGAERDPEPDLAQWPLMSVQRKLRASRMMLEVVRPGSCEELEDHLETRAAQGVQFGLVHFDMHGRILKDTSGKQVPCLLFARKTHISTGHGYQVPQTSPIAASDVARLLARHQVENVVLNACLSAYNRTTPATNLARIFLRHGVRNVSAMWFYVHWQTVATYLEAFYDELLVRCTEFHAAAQRGRLAVRQKPTSRTGREYQDFFLCVNYTRAAAHHADRARVRGVSPTPSAKSQDSSTSNTSGKSFKNGGGGGSLWRPSTPRLSDGFLAGSEEPVMRMKLHLLELEYKLLTFRIVYASDLRRADSSLSATLDRMVSMWLGTNLVDEVLFYKAKDFAKRRLLSNVSPRERRTRSSFTYSGGGGGGGSGSGSGGGSASGYLQLLFPRGPLKALRQTVHVVRDVDSVVDPGMQADADSNARSEARRHAAQENLQRFVQKVLSSEGDTSGSGSGGIEGGGGSGSYVLLLGSQDAQWWRTYLQHLGGEWWVHMPWSFTLHSRLVGGGGGSGGEGSPGSGSSRFGSPVQGWGGGRSPSPMGL